MTRSLLAVLCVLMAALAWQYFIVSANYGGNWTALFYSGDRFPTPPVLADEHVYRFANSNGYDGQFYHDVAHDPLMRRGLYRYIDAPSIRYDRILVPALANLLAFGADARVDAAYFAVVLLFTGLGTWWLARYAAHFGRSPYWGMGFLLVPAVLTSLDRMVVDVALAALCVGWVWYGIAERPVALWVVLAMAALARETGLILVAAQAIWYWWNSRFRRSLAMAAAALPSLCWRLYVAGRVPVSHLETAHLFPFSGVVVRLFHPNHYAMPLPIQVAATLTDYLALAGILLAVGLVGQAATHRRLSPADLALYGFALLAAFLFMPDAWTDSYAFGRTLSPLLLLLVLGALSGRGWLRALPMGMVAPSILLVYAAQIYHAAGR